MWALDIATALVALFFFGIALLCRWGDAQVAQEKARKREEQAHEDFVRNFSDMNIAQALASPHATMPGQVDPSPPSIAQTWANH